QVDFIPEAQYPFIPSSLERRYFLLFTKKPINSYPKAYILKYAVFLSIIPISITPKRKAPIPGRLTSRSNQVNENVVIFKYEVIFHFLSFCPSKGVFVQYESIPTKTLPWLLPNLLHEKWRKKLP